MSYPLRLTSLTPREAVADALYRVCIGLDRNDAPLFDSAWAGEDVYLAVHDGEDRIFKSLAEIHANGLSRVGPMDTTHIASNVRVELQDGASIASLTAYVLAQHAAPGRGKIPGAPKFLVGGEVAMDLVRDQSDGLWKITKWIFDIIWRQGDISVTRGSG